jgi:hypothetical protein
MSITNFPYIGIKDISFVEIGLAKTNDGISIIYGISMKKNL